MPKRKLYTRDQIDAAVSDVKRRRLNPSKAAREHGVPRQTIIDAIKRGHSIDSYGPPRMLSTDEEAALVEYLKYMGRRGFPLSRQHLKGYVMSLIDTSNRKTLFKESGPSDKWCKQFISRYPEFSEKEPQVRDRGRTRMSNSSVIDGFFKKYEETINRLDLAAKPGQIYNCDETGFVDKQGSRKKVIGEKGRPCIQQKINTIDHVTAHLCASGDGRMMASFLIYKKSLPHRSYREDVPRDWVFGVSESGYMDTDLFRTWFRTVFLNHCTKERPVLLLMDNHDSHISIPVIEMAREQNIEILAFPAHTTHLLQPLDVNIIGPVKEKMRSLATSMSLANSKMTVSKSNLPALLSYAIDQTCSPGLIKSAFRKSGLIPLNPEAIDTSLLIPEDFSKSQGAPDSGSSAVASTSGTSSTEKVAISSCDKCGHSLLPHPIEAVRKLPPILQEIFITPVLPEKKPKNKRVVLEARTITCDAMLQQLKNKEEENKRRNEAIEERKREREARKAGKDKGKGRGKGKGKGKANRINVAVLEEDAEDEEDDTVVCGVCQKRDTEEIEEDEDQAITFTSWIQCEVCDMWFHQECVDAVSDDFICTLCS